MADASEEGTAQGYNAGSSLIPSCWAILYPQQHQSLFLGQKEGFCKPGATYYVE